MLKHNEFKPLGKVLICLAVCSVIATSIVLNCETTRDIEKETFVLESPSASTVVLWQQTWGAAGLDTAFAVALDSQKNTYVVGDGPNFGSTGTSAIVLLKYGSTGVESWERVWDGPAADYSRDMAIDSQDNVYIAGFTRSYGNGSDDALLVKFDKDGNYKWNTTWGTASSEVVYGIAIGIDDSIYLGGRKTITSSNYDIIALKFDNNGTRLWNKTWGNSFFESSDDVSVDSAGNLYIMGSRRYTTSGQVDMMLLRFDTNGNYVWNKTWGTSSTEWGRGVCIRSADEIYVVGERSASFLIITNKYNSSGDLLWSSTWTASGYPAPEDITFDDEGSAYIVGQCNEDLLLLKYNSTGSYMWNKTLGFGTNAEWGYGITIDDQRNIYLTGTTGDGFQQSDLWTLKVTNNFAVGTNAGNPDVDGNFDLFWEPSPQADNYSVYEHDHPITEINGSLTVVAQGIVGTGLSVIGRGNGTYYYAVQAVNMTLNVTSNCIMVEVRLFLPDHFILTTNAGNPDVDGEFNLTWGASTYADNYSVYTSNRYITQINATTTLLQIGNTNRTYAAKRLVNGTYYYAIVAINEFGSRLSDNCIRVLVVHAVIWERAVTLGEELNDITRDAAGNLYVVGTDTIAYMQWQLYVAKLNSTGGVIWSQTYGAIYGRGLGVAVDPFGNVFACGSSSSNMLLLKYSSTGVYQWNRIIGGAPVDEAFRVAIDSGNNVIVAGTTASYGAGNEDAIIVKYDNNGNLQWQRTWGLSATEWCLGLALDTSNNIYITGTTNSTGAGQTDIFIAKYNSAGIQQWNQTWGTSVAEGFIYAPSGITLDSAGNAYIASCIWPGTSDTCIIKYDAAGIQQWNITKAYTAASDLACDIIVDPFENIYITGQMRYVLLSQFNQAGVCVYNNTWGKSLTSYVAMAYDPAGYVYIAKKNTPAILKVALTPEPFTLATNAGSPDTNGAFDLTWQPSTNSKNYSIYRHSSFISSVNDSIKIASGLTNTSKSFTNYATGTYYFAVVSFNEYGGCMSNCIRVDVLLSPPGSFTLSANGGNPDIDGAFDLSWTAAFEVKNYSIYRHDEPITTINGSLVLVASGLVNQSHHLANLPTGTHYYIAVAINDFGSRLSNCIQKAVLLGPPGTLTLSSNAGFPDGDGIFTLSWTVAEGAKNYTVYYSTSTITSIGPSTIPVANGLTGTSYYISGMASGLNHYFAVVAYNDYGNRLSNSLWVYVSTSNPAKPGFFRLTTDATYPDIDGTFNLNWDAASGATNYSVYRSTYFVNNVDTNSVLVVSGNTNRTFHFDGHATGTFYYVVVAYNPAGNRTSACLTIVVQMGPPGAFTMSSNAGSPDIDGAFSLTWTASGGAVNYSIYDHTGFITTINGSVHQLASGIGGLTFPVSGLANGTYYYIVVAFNAEGNRSSNCISIVVAHSSPGTFTVSSDAGTPDGDGAFTLSWTAASGASNYTVFTHATPITTINGSVAVVASGLAGLSRQVTGLTNGTYYYAIVAFNVNGNSTSNCFGVTVMLVPPAAFTMTSDAGSPDPDGSFSLNWTSSAGATNYSVYAHDHYITEINVSVAAIGTGTTSLGLLVQGLPNGTYYYIVVAYNDYGNRTSNCIGIDVERIPPGSFTLASDAGTPDDDGQFLLSWTASAGAENYNVYIHTSPITQINMTVTAIATGVAGLTRSVYGLANGTYYFAVVAFNSNGNRTSNCVAATVEVHLPGQFLLTSTAGSPDSDGRFALNWTTSTLANNYSLYYSVGFITEMNNTVYFVMGRLTNHSLLLTMVPSGTHYFVVVATNQIGNTSSNCVQVTVQLAIPGPFTLSSDAPVPDDDGRFTLSWTASVNATNYSVYVHSRPITAINTSVQLVAAGYTNTTIAINGLASGTYYLIVVAFNDLGNCSSNCITVVVAIPGGGSIIDHILKFLTDYWMLVLGVAAGIVVLAVIAGSRRKKATRMKAKKGRVVPPATTTETSSSESAGEMTRPSKAPGDGVEEKASGGPISAPHMAVAKFFCPSCNLYQDVPDPDMKAWYNCPGCGMALQFIKTCPHCNQPTALTKEQYDYYKNQPMECWSCKKEVKTS
jgi:hypothetical protein